MNETARRAAGVMLFGLTVATGLLFVATPVAIGQAQPIDENHFRCYIVSQQTPQPAEAITLEDQFTTAPVPVMVGEPVMFCVPTAKTAGTVVFPIEDEQEHFTLYTAPSTATPRDVLISDQFGTDVPWHLTTPRYVMVPTAKTIDGQTFDDRDNMNHYWCYEASGPGANERVTLDDQFGGPDQVRVARPTLLCTPAEKVHNGNTFDIEDEDLHLACYEIHGKQKTQQFTFTAENQFETDEFQIAAWEMLCAPAEKQLTTAPFAPFALAPTLAGPANRPAVGGGESPVKSGPLYCRAAGTGVKCSVGVPHA